MKKKVLKVLAFIIEPPESSFCYCFIIALMAILSQKK